MTARKINRELYAGNIPVRSGYGAGDPRFLGCLVLLCGSAIRALSSTINSICRKWMLMSTDFDALPKCNHRSVHLVTLFFAFGFIILGASNAYGYEYYERREQTSYYLSSNVDLAEGIHAEVLPYNGNVLDSYARIKTISCDDYVSSLDLSNSITCEVSRITWTWY